jgi:hypothetical protein
LQKKGAAQDPNKNLGKRAKPRAKPRAKTVKAQETILEITTAKRTRTRNTKPRSIF